MKPRDGVTRVKEGLRKREMRGGLNITSPLKKRKSIDEFWKKRRKEECGCETEEFV